MVGWYLERADPALARLWKVSAEKSAYDFTNWEAEKDAWIREFHERVRVLSLLPIIYTPIYDTFGQVWDARGFDAIIGPGLASPALIHK